MYNIGISFYISEVAMRKKYFFMLLTLLWIGFIFYNSSKPGVISNERSKDLAKAVLNAFNDDTNYISLHSLNQNNMIIRKLAHGFEYFTLSILISLTLCVENSKSKFNSPIYILFGCLFLANLDEFYQLFIPGRTSSVKDVFIDFLGAITGFLLISLINSALFRGRTLIKHKEIKS